MVTRKRRGRSQPLDVWANGELVGTWTAEGRLPTEFCYAPSWLESPSARPLSLSLPLPLVGNTPLRGNSVAHYFENLLPDSASILKRLANRYTAGSTDTFDLLTALGRDCVGAIQLLPQGEAPTGFDKIEGEVLDDKEIAAMLRSAVSGTDFAQQDKSQDFRISIAGAQEKTGLLRYNGQWMRPLGATPTTHIVKLPLGLVGNMQADMRTSVHNEWFCLKFLRALGLEVANAEVAHFDDHAPVLVVERFDRRMHTSGSWIVRLPQEDFCQAYGVSSSQKYEADGGPGVANIAQVLANSVQARKDLKTLLVSQLAFWLLAATDGHAKNFSLRILAGNAYHLTPLYDVLSAWPIIGKAQNKLALRDVKLAMALKGKNRHYHLSTIVRRHFNATAAACGWGADMEDLLGETLPRVPGALEEVMQQLPATFPADVAEAICSGVKAQVSQI